MPFSPKLYVKHNLGLARFLSPPSRFIQFLWFSVSEPIMDGHHSINNNSKRMVGVQWHKTRNMKTLNNLVVILFILFLL